jgi:hypothetical protein
MVLTGLKQYKQALTFFRMVRRCCWHSGTHSHI